MLLSEKNNKSITESFMDGKRNLDTNSDFLTYAARIADGANAINKYITSLYQQIPEEEYDKDYVKIDKIFDRLCDEVFTTKAFMVRLEYEPGWDAVADFTCENEAKIRQILSEHPIIAKYVTKF